MTFLVVGILFFSTQPTPANADSIILKNGRTIISEKCWDDGAMIKCKRYGAKVGYQKVDIDEIVMISKKNELKNSGRLSGPKSAVRKSTLGEVDLYRLDIAYKVHKYWAFAGEDMKNTENKAIVAITFNVLPDGSVSDIQFVEKSKNMASNESAYTAIKKAAPFPPHPEGYSRPYLQLGLRFTPRGVQ
jgi:TonB family protein